MQGVGQNFGRLPKVLLFLCLAEVIEGQGSCESSLLQTHAPNAPEPSEAASCLSFIHIPKTGGFSIEMARLSAAGISAPEGHNSRNWQSLEGCTTWRGQVASKCNQVKHIKPFIIGTVKGIEPLVLLSLRSRSIMIVDAAARFFEDRRREREREGELPP